MNEFLQETLHLYSTADALRALFDFFLVTIGIYGILVLIRGTPAVRMLLGLLLIIGGYFLSKDEALGLSTVNWLLEKFISSFILVVIVLFQDDIRRGLLKVGKTSFFAELSSVSGTLIIEEVVQGAKMMSDARIGALIVLELNGDLSVFADEAVQIDSIVSKEQLYAVFNPANANPLHDGALIIRGKRILAAGCFLPLTSNPRISKMLGTRHRAAIGLSEESDAAIVVVSEETGNTSLVKNGEIKRGLNTNDLRDALQTIFGIAAQTNNKE